MTTHPGFKKLLESSRFFEVQFSGLVEENSIDPKVLELIINYVVSYFSYFDLADEQITEKHMNFLTEYKTHLKKFEKTGMYPYQYQKSSVKERIDYDIPLLCSSFLSFPRYRIFETLSHKIDVQPDQNILVIGIGPGIELSILAGRSNEIVAYDTDIGAFIKTTFPEVRFFEKEFRHEPNQSYDRIILIELLEHIENYELVLVDAMKSLSPDGRIHFTTAVNIPQFDHLHNFELKDSKLDHCISTNGFEIEYQLDVPHNYLSKVAAYNCYYIIRRIT